MSTYIKSKTIINMTFKLFSLSGSRLQESMSSCYCFSPRPSSLLRGQDKEETSMGLSKKEAPSSDVISRAS